MGHVLMENRNGLVVDSRLVPGDRHSGEGDRISMAAEIPDDHRVIMGGQGIRHQGFRHVDRGNWRSLRMLRSGQGFGNRRSDYPAEGRCGKPEKTQAGG